MLAGWHNLPCSGQQDQSRDLFAVRLAATLTGSLAAFVKPEPAFSQAIPANFVLPCPSSIFDLTLRLVERAPFLRFRGQYRVQRRHFSHKSG